MVRLSVVVITLNEERNLDRCLTSVRDLCDEIIVVDSHSGDRTVEIAEQHNAKVVRQAFLGYVAQKNFATEQAKNNWILSIDADEAVSDELRTAILKVKASPEQDAYYVSRLTNYCGKWIRHCGWYPDKKIRLYDRTKGRWVGEQIHESWEPHSGGSAIGALTGDLLHYSYYTISDHLKQIEKFSEILASRAIAQGKLPGLLKVLLAPKWKFFTDYFIKLGFLDGYHGYLVCKLSAFATFVKYSKIRQYASMAKEEKRI
jgi:glycosyltransferase involved in cell wall biosynthesis